MAVGLSYIAFIMLRWITPHDFYHEVVLDFVRGLLEAIEMIVRFLSSSQII